MLSWKVILIIIAILILAVIPMFPITTAPEWKITAVLGTGGPAAAEDLVEVWQDYPFCFRECSDHNESATTDQNGVVVFPARSHRTSALRYLIVKVWSLLPKATDPSRKRATSFVTCQSGKCEAIYYYYNEHLPQTLTVER